MKIGVLDIQGSVEEHFGAIEALNVGANGDTGAGPVEAILVKRPEQIAELDGLIIPGGESTAISKLLFGTGIARAISRRSWGKHALPIWGTCAGAILLAKKIHQQDGRAPRSLKLMNMTIERNGYGRQQESFETSINIGIPNEKNSKKTFPALFIRAPRVLKHGRRVRCLADIKSEPIMLREGRYLATMFHPELTDDLRIHKYFVEQLCAKPTNNEKS